ncbi:MAG: BMC domain-containing protein [Caldilineaceae bacterium]|nr:BMC domain-containing protein [Caldilineaceae bacterium]HRJ43668.1 BMC domain-containing protein [Caldilineaceae bacterium]
MQPAPPISLSISPALALLEFESIAAGYLAADAMTKRAPIARIVAGTVQPGRLLVLLSGGVAEVEEAAAAGREISAGSLLDEVFLPAVHPGVVAGLLGERHPIADALGIVESHSAASAIHAGDAGLKGAEVALVELRLSDGLAGKGICFFTGTVSAVEVAVEIASAAVSPGHFLHAVVIPQLSPEIAATLHTGSNFSQNLQE